ncbi:carbohydrate ABC transporter permease [Pseudoclavibacter caeni]|jgi:sn-glycerol 3-phosphate transport system permease protein|uniref:Carbohydrate ABC transporter permease n=1 Tax=Pseudoclavibacter caeni TaxID=908846 RepID=A0A7C8FVF3_9MICO|nr:carbohydrate ABC transporter permease [Pseudoclavibacter caeni]NYJ96439.1 sn-glycerol 3-phosphate transport system permease protein [Pseudoclavibacter caeni]
MSVPSITGVATVERVAEARGPRRGRLVHLDLGALLTMLLAGVVMVFPLLWMIVSSFKQQDEIFTIPLQWLPHQIQFENYAEVAQTLPIGRLFLNSAIVTVIGAGVKVLLGLTTAYALVFIDFPFKRVIFVVVLAALMVPQQITIIPNYTLVSSLGWVNSYQGIIMPGLASAFGTFLFRQHFLTLPRSVLESAEVDGAGHWRRLWGFVVPMSAPTIVAVALVAIVTEWNEYLWPLLIIDKPDMMTLPVGLTLLQNVDGSNNWGVILAATVLVTLPVLAVFLLMQKRLVAGLTAGAVKG